MERFHPLITSEEKKVESNVNKQTNKSHKELIKLSFYIKSHH